MKFLPKCIGILMLFFSFHKLTAQTIVKAEYYFDKDPGISKGVSVPVKPNQPFAIDTQIPTNGMATGFHNLYFRFRDSNGHWSLAEGRTFTISDLDPKEKPKIVASEYFFDKDPGTGKGVSVPMKANEPFTIDTQIPTNGITTGFHNLYFRFRDSNGHWSLAEGRTFTISDLDPKEKPKIVASEYYFDKDPGIGKGVSLPVKADEPFTIDTQIPTNGMATGFHNLYFRFRDSNGHWSLAEGRTFTISDLDPKEKPKIVASEYYFDKDPGIGRGVSVPVKANEPFTIDTQIPTNGMATGFHNLYFRFRDSKGHWSLAEGRTFTISDSNFTAKPTIVLAEYYFDDDRPSYGEGKPLFISKDQHEIDSDKNIDITGLTLGKHSIYFRIQDNQGIWSFLEKRDFEVVVPKITSITPNSGGNIGDVTVMINGQGFEANSTIKLTREGHEDIVVPDSLWSILDGKTIQATFDLRRKELGDYDVEVTRPNNQVLKIPNGFKIEEGIAADPWAEVIGFDVIRRGQWQTYNITYGNRGNVDAIAVPVWIVIPKEAEIEEGFEIFKPQENSVSWDTIPMAFSIDSLFEKPLKAQILPIIIPIVPAKTTGTLNLQIKVEQQLPKPFQIICWASDPMYSSYSKLGVSSFSGRFNSINAEKSKFDCYANLISIGLGFIPGIGCATGILDAGLRPIIKLSLTGDNGLFLKEGAQKGQFDAVSFFWTVVQAGIGCIPGGQLVGKAEEALSSITKANSFISGTNAFLTCTEDYNPSKVTVRTVTSFDPNDKLGSRGAGTKQFLSESDPFLYQIRFENKSEATAPAQSVQIIDSLDTNVLDISTLELGFFGFGDRLINILPGQKSFIRNIDLRPKNNLILRVEANLNDQNGVLTWHFTSLDPTTMQPTKNPLAGFLPPNQTAPEGEGGVFYTIRPKTNLPTNTTISNKAYIYFDTNEPIITPTWKNTIDKSLPESRVKPLSEAQYDTTFQVQWDGSDEGSGILDYTIYVSTNYGEYVPWLINTSSTSALFNGKIDSTYRFYSIARDSTSLKEFESKTYEAITTITSVTGLEYPIENKIIVYPNPTNSIISINIPEELKPALIFLSDLTGQQVTAFSQDQRDFNVSLLPSGIYILKIQTNKGSIFRKVIIR